MQSDGQRQHFEMPGDLWISTQSEALHFEDSIRSADEPNGLSRALPRFDVHDLTADIGSIAARKRDAATISRLKMELDAQACHIRQQEASLAHSQSIFERASKAARIGVWECDLPGDTLHWTSGTYDLFDVPRGSALDRNEILNCYTPASAEMLHVLRSKAIEERTGFTMDAEIVTPKGNRRWIRLTATVESENGVAARIFGIKQDITEEKLLWERTRYLAEFDVMTGLANRSQFQSKLSDLCAPNDDRNAGGTLLLVDLDGFKDVNDTFGHASGDECLKEVSQRLASVCSGAELVARVGGDEFAVLLGSHLDRSAVEDIAGQIVHAISKPVDRGSQMFNLSASIGIARVEASTSSELFRKADTALYAAKAAGRNTFRIFNPDMTQAPSAVRQWPMP
jgi:diguanylate cyclase (GGDEF)-like protein